MHLTFTFGGGLLMNIDLEKYPKGVGSRRKVV